MPGLRYLLLTLLVMCIACGKRPVAKPIAWRDLGAGEAETQRTGKPALIYVCAAWSVGCRDLDRSFDDAAVREVTERFVPIRIDVTDDEELDAKRAKARFHIQGVPTLLVLDSLDLPSGGEGFDILRLHHPEPPSKLAPMLERAADEHATRSDQVHARMRMAEAAAHEPAPPWPTDYAAARATAAAEHKPLFLIVGATWTADSAHMEHTTLAHPVIRDMLADSVVVRVESTSPEARGLAATGPTAILFNVSGREAYRVSASISVEALVMVLHRHHGAN